MAFDDGDIHFALTHSLSCQFGLPRLMASKSFWFLVVALWITDAAAAAVVVAIITAVAAAAVFVVAVIAAVRFVFN